MFQAHIHKRRGYVGGKVKIRQMARESVLVAGFRKPGCQTQKRSTGNTGVLLQERLEFFPKCAGQIASFFLTNLGALQNLVGNILFDTFIIRNL